MRSTFTISLPRKLARELDDFTAEQEVSRSEIIRDSLRDYLFVRRFRQLRGRTMKKAQERDIYTDQDVFDLVS